MVKFHSDVILANPKIAAWTKDSTAVVFDMTSFFVSDNKKMTPFDENSVYGNFEKVKIRRKDRMPFAMNMDGELLEEHDEWEAEIVRKGLHLVVPKGVRV